MPRLLPDWLAAYEVFTQGSKSPDRYHKWVGLSMLAGAVRRRVKIDVVFFRVYPNLYVVLTSPPGVGKKTTAMGIGMELLKEAAVFGAIPGIKLGAASSSRKQMIVDLSKSCDPDKPPSDLNASALTFVASELTTLLATSREDMVQTLTDLFDCPTMWEHRTEGFGKHQINYPFLNLLAGVTPQEFANSQASRIISTGLASRMIFVWADHIRKRPWLPAMSDDMIKLRELLVSDLAHIANLSGSYRLDDEADALYGQYEEEINPKEIKRADPRVASYYSRKPIHALRVALLLTVAKHDEPVIAAAEIRHALNILHDVEKDIQYVYGGVGRSLEAPNLNDILIDMLQRPEGASMMELLDKFKFNMQRHQLAGNLQVLRETGYVELRGERWYAKGLTNGPGAVAPDAPNGNSPLVD